MLQKNFIQKNDKRQYRIQNEDLLFVIHSNFIVLQNPFDTLILFLMKQVDIG